VSIAVSCENSTKKKKKKKRVKKKKKKKKGEKKEKKAICLNKETTCKSIMVGKGRSR